MSASAQRHLVVFARSPRMGLVKSRLGRDIGVVAALEFYRSTLPATLRRLSRHRRWRCWLALDRKGGYRRGLLGDGGWTIVDQGTGDLGGRMTRILQSLPPGPVVIAGSDLPDLRAGHVAHAFAALGRADAVFGPALDGGFWLMGVGSRARRRQLFADVRWSSRWALSDTLANLSGMSVEFLELMRDVDDGASYAAWRRRAT
jgi:rSAM/selenodomain-associated transferase 1